MAEKKRKKKAPAARRELVLNSGRREITGETEKYWLCGNTQFRKNNPRILRIEEVQDAEFEDVPEEPADGAEGGADAAVAGAEAGDAG